MLFFLFALRVFPSILENGHDNSDGSFTPGHDDGQDRDAAPDFHGCEGDSEPDQIRASPIPELPVPPDEEQDEGGHGGAQDLEEFRELFRELGLAGSPIQDPHLHHKQSTIEFLFNGQEIIFSQKMKKI